LAFFQQAANFKNSDARVNLAMEYYRHDATMMDSIKLFEQAAESKHILAFWHLGQIYEQGIGKDAPSCDNAVAVSLGTTLSVSHSYPRFF
jgi:TPR repeat protein